MCCFNKVSLSAVLLVHKRTINKEISSAMYPIVALLQQIKRSNSQSYYKDRSIMQEEKQAKVRDERISRGMQPSGFPVLTYLWYHSHMLLLALTLDIVDVMVALHKSLLFLQMRHKCSNVVKEFFIVHQQLMCPSLCKMLCQQFALRSLTLWQITAPSSQTVLKIRHYDPSKHQGSLNITTQHHYLANIKLSKQTAATNQPSCTSIYRVKKILCVISKHFHS